MAEPMNVANNMEENGPQVVPLDNTFGFQPPNPPADLGIAIKPETAVVGHNYYVFRNMPGDIPYKLTVNEVNVDQDDGSVLIVGVKNNNNNNGQVFEMFSELKNNDGQFLKYIYTINTNQAGGRKRSHRRRSHRRRSHRRRSRRN